MSEAVGSPDASGLRVPLEETPGPPARPRTLLPALISVAIAAPLCFRPVWDTDAGWHVAVGRLIREGRFPHVNALSWTALVQRWYPTTWLYDLLAAIGADTLPGAFGLQLSRPGRSRRRDPDPRSRRRERARTRVQR